MAGEIMAQVESTTGVNSFKINLLEESQYQEAKEAGTVVENQLYMTPIVSKDFEFFHDADGDLCIRYNE